MDPKIEAVGDQVSWMLDGSHVHHQARVRPGDPRHRRRHERADGDPRRGEADRADCLVRLAPGCLDFVFNNAGIQGKGGPIVDMDEAAFDELIAINLKDPWLMTRAALEAMIPAGRGGAIVNTSSFLSTAATVGTSGYSASKAGRDAMIRAIALEAGPHGICVNNVNPGVIDTPMLRAHGDEIVPPLAARAALCRVGTPEDIADVAVWLCTDEARFITGQSLLVDGGFTIPGPR